MQSKKKMRKFENYMKALVTDFTHVYEDEGFAVPGRVWWI